ASGLSPAQISRILSAAESPSLHALAAISAAMGGRAVVRIDPGTGPAIRDRFQGRVVEALIRILDPRWKGFLEAPACASAGGLLLRRLPCAHRGPGAMARLRNPLGHCGGTDNEDPARAAPRHRRGSLIGPSATLAAHVGRSPPPNPCREDLG